VVARSEGRHPSTDSGQAPACPYTDAALKSNWTTTLHRRFSHAWCSHSARLIPVRWPT